MASQSLTWKQCRPTKDAPPFDGDLDAVDARQVAKRRPMIEAYCQYLLPNPGRDLEAVRVESREIGHQVFCANGRENIGHEKAEFMVDKNTWRKFFDQLPEGERPVYPWLGVDVRTLPKHPVSVPYQQWMAAGNTRPASTEYSVHWSEQPPQVHEPRSTVSKKRKEPTQPGPSRSQSSGSQSQQPEQAELPKKQQKLQGSNPKGRAQPSSTLPSIEAQPASLPPPLIAASGLKGSLWAPRTPSTAAAHNAKAAEMAQMPPLVPFPSFRQQLWDQFFPGTPCDVAPICGPFELLVPGSINFDVMVLGDNGFGLKQANDIVGPVAAIAWAEANDRGAKTLIVGFKRDGNDRIDMGNTQNQNAVRDAWFGVRDWAIEALKNSGQTLDDWLMIRQLSRLASDLHFDPADPHAELKSASFQAEGQDASVSERQVAAIRGERLAAMRRVTAILLEHSTFETIKFALSNWVCESELLNGFDRVRLAAVVWRKHGGAAQEVAVASCMAQIVQQLSRSQQV